MLTFVNLIQSDGNHPRQRLTQHFVRKRTVNVEDATICIILAALISRLWRKKVGLNLVNCDGLRDRWANIDLVL